MVTKKKKKRLIPKGTPYPGEPQYGFVDAARTEKESDRIVDRIQKRDRDAATIQTHIPDQWVVYKNHWKKRPLTPKLRITKRMPKLR